MTGVHPGLADAFTSLDACGARWCLLRGRDRIADPEGDVDLLVHPADRDRAGRALEDAGFVRLRSWAAGTQNFFLAYHAATDRWIYLHVVPVLDFGPMHALRLPVGAESVLSRGVPDEGVPGPSPDDAFWITLLHALVDKGRMSPKHRAALAELSPAVSPHGPVGTAVDGLGFRSGGAARLLDDVRGGRWAELEADAVAMAAAWRRTDRAWAVRGRRHRASLLAAKLREIVTRRGVATAVVAPDGAGKSTLIASLADASFFTLRTYYLGLEGGRFAGSGPSRIPGGGLARRLAHAWGTWLRAQVDLSRRRWVVFDRYPYEALLPPSGPVGPASRLRRAVLGHALPAPDLVVFLDAPGSVLHRRKAEHPPERLERDRQGYRALAEQRGWTIVDATAGPDDVRRRVTEAMWRRYRRRHGKG